jgi:uncharacterized protein (TIGR03437 family)
MRNAVRIIILAGTAALAGWAQPVIQSVVNPASHIPPGAPHYGLAPSSFIAVEGAGLGPAEGVFVRGLPLVTSAEGVSIEVTVGQQKINPYLLVLQASRLLAILPENTPIGRGALRVTYNNSSSAPFDIRVASSAIGFFTLNGSGRGPLLALTPDLDPSTVYRPLRPGSLAIILGTGYGSATPAAAGALPDQHSLAAILESVRDLPPDGRVASSHGTFRIGNQTIQPLYNGPLGPPAIAGAVIRVPDMPGCAVPFYYQSDINSDVLPSNVGTLSIGASDPCDDPIGLTQEWRRRFSMSPTIRLAGLVRERFRSANIAQPSQITRQFNALFASAEDVPFQPFKDDVQSSFGCQEWNFAGLTGENPIEAFFNFLGMGTVAVTLPNGQSGTIPEVQGFPGRYAGMVPEAGFDAGTIRFRAGGSDFVPAFDIDLQFLQPLPNVLPNVDFTNLQNGGILRSRNLMINTSGWPDYPDHHFRVDVISLNPALNQGGRVLCRYPSTMQQIVVPRWALERLPPSGMRDGAPAGSVQIRFSPNRNPGMELPGGRLFEYTQSFRREFTGIAVQ